MAAPSLPGVDWVEVRRACEAGMTMEEAAKEFGIKQPSSIRARASREGWLTAGKVRERMQQMQRIAAQPQKALSAVAKTLVERQEEHRSIVHRTILKALKAAEKAPPSIESMTDYEKAVKVHRLNLDMTTGDQTQVAVTFWHGEAGGPGASRDVGDVIEAETVESEVEDVDWV